MEPSGTLAFYLCLLLSLACVHAKSPHSCPALCDPMDCVACEAPLDMGFSRQEYWNRLPCPPSEDLPDPWIEPESLRSPALLGRFFTTSTTWEASGRPFSHVHDLVVSGWLCCLHMSNLYARYKEGNEVWPFHSRKEGPPPPPPAPDFLLYLNGQNYDTCPPLASRETGKSIILAFLPQR